MEEITRKVCSHCKKEYPVTMFHKSSTSKDGYQSMCKLCSNESARLSAAKKKKAREEANFKAQLDPTNDRIILKDGTVLKKKEDESVNITLADFSARQLLAELKARGYVWENMWIKQTVDYQKI